MESKVSFREYLRDKIGIRRPEYSFMTAYDFTILSILADKSFPDDENDGLEVKRYVQKKQYETQRRTYFGNYDFNRAILYHTERLWEEYKDYLRSDRE